MKGKVSVVILTHNSTRDIERCLESVMNQTYTEREIYLLDNASNDDTVAIARKQCPEANILISESNLGFANAHNHGVITTNSPYYLPLNPDIIIYPQYIEQLVKHMDINDRVGSVSGKLLFMTEDGMKTDILYTTGHLLTKSRSPSNRGYKERDTGRYDQPELIFAANGAAPLYRRAMLEDIALNGEIFCTDFFMYGEDHDLGWRAQLRGWKSIYEPRAIGFHRGFGSGGIKSFYIQCQFTRNRYLTLVRNDCFIDILRDLPFIILYEVIWQIYTLFQNPKRFFAHWIGLLQALSGLPKMLQKRKQIFQNRTTDKSYIRSFFVSKLW
jgi:GT2 family glycosyltransferase